mmetsp:Transcript_3434/g.7543  ORF Transcript_3434/g.7543 Transcript_3434/m.7543 type:complete len:155 (-) Transcript_3434:542-1006(-)
MEVGVGVGVGVNVVGAGVGAGVAPDRHFSSQPSGTDKPEEESDDEDVGAAVDQMLGDDAFKTHIALGSTLNPLGALGRLSDAHSSVDMEEGRADREGVAGLVAGARQAIASVRMLRFPHAEDGEPLRPEQSSESADTVRTHDKYNSGGVRPGRL